MDQPHHDGDATPAEAAGQKDFVPAGASFQGIRKLSINTRGKSGIERKRVTFKKEPDVTHVVAALTGWSIEFEGGDQNFKGAHVAVDARIEWGRDEVEVIAVFGLKDNDGKEAYLGNAHVLVFLYGS